jgi:hypothetical protein
VAREKRLGGGPAQARGAPRAAQTGPIHELLALQRLAGNSAVDHLLRVQRYDAFEHANEGDRAPGSTTVSVGTDQLPGGTRIGGVQLTSGEINALADLYGSPDELYRADPAEVARVVALVRRQQADPHSVSEAEWDQATGGRYNRLNLANRGHFGPHNPDLINPQGGSASLDDNRQEFLRNYNLTIVDAQTAYMHIGLLDPAHTQEWLDRATIAAGFAEHYIMDAFSAGHLFNKDDFNAVAQGNLDQLTDGQRSRLFQTVASGVLSHSDARDLLGQYEPTTGIGLGDRFAWGIVQWRPNFNREFAFKALLEHLYADPLGRQAIYGALVKVVHDELNTRHAENGQIGVPVENNHRSPWVLSGDRTLATSPDTQAEIEAAIVQFRQTIEPYRHGLVPGQGATPGVDLVTAYFPRPTADSARMISQTIRFVTDPATGMSQSLVDVMVRELPSILSALEAHGDIRRA